MKAMNIGAQIRRLRLASGMTQEQLAERLGVTFQTISKWENSLTAPDLSMLPALADLFRVSTDELLCYNGKARAREIADLSVRAWQCRQAGDMAGATAILNQGLARFPGDEVLLNCLLYSTQDREERIRTATALCESATLPDVRYDAARFLAQDYAAAGSYDMARAALEKIPEFYFTKLTVAAQVLPGEEKQQYARQQRNISLGHLVDMQVELARYHDAAGQSEQAAAERERGAAVIALFDLPQDFAALLRARLDGADGT